MCGSAVVRRGCAPAAAGTLRAGAVHINETSRSCVDGMPYGGIKDIGHVGQGLRYAIRDMMDERVVRVSLPGLPG